MSLTCTCPGAAALGNIDANLCPEDIGQIQKIIFQRLKTDAGALNEFAAEPLLKAAWTTLLTALDSTKVIVSPYVSKPEINAGAAITQGSGNEVLNGIPMVVGEEPTPATFVLYGATSTTMNGLKALRCENNNLGCYFVNAAGQIIMQKVGSKFRPFPINGYFAGSKKIGGHQAKDENMLSFYLNPGYSDTLYVMSPTDFNGTSDLVNS